MTAAIDTTADKDFFYFYIASASTSTKAALTVGNLGGSGQPSEIDATLLDSFGAYAGGDFVYLKSGESKASTVELEPGKYFIEVVARGGHGDSYTIMSGGEPGAFSDYATIAARCAAAKARVKRLEGALDRAETALQRANGRIQRSRYSPQARKTALALRRKAKIRVAAGRRALAAATRQQRPWCFIPR